MKPAIPFTGLAPDARAVRGGGDLSSFDVQAAVEAGRRLRRACAGDCSTADVAAALVETVNALELDGRPACVLVRAFVTRRLGDLPPELREELRAASPASPSDPAAPCLCLVATRGIEPSWNEVASSRSHRALPLRDGAPMAVELARQLGLEGPARRPAGAFYVAEAASSPAIPDKEFVTAYGVRSVVGSGATVWPGESFAVVAFSRGFVERRAASAFEILALHARVAWGCSREARAFLGDLAFERARGAALEELASSLGDHLREDALDARRRLEATRAEAGRAAEVSASMLKGQNDHLQRTQRAMLNVIEDLRDAREALASKVEERTHELAAANSQLEARNRELEEFVYIASHDLQEPLRTVAGYLQMIERRYGGKLGVEGDEFIRFSIEGAQRMQSLIESLLVYSRVATRKSTLELLPLDEAVDTALSNLALRIEETGASVERSKLPHVRADRIQMTQLFQNLLSNAIKFSGPKPPRVHISGEIAGDTCTICVKDEGLGFNPRFVDRIFKVFRRLRRDTPGTGIGLAICKKIVERHGGRIEASSQPGEGASFFVHLPAGQPPQGDR